MTIIEIEYATPEYDDTVHLRDSILRKPLREYYQNKPLEAAPNFSLYFTEEQLSAEYADFHIAAYDNAWILRGCLILTPKAHKVMKMRQVAVDATLQKTGIGRALVAASEAFSREKGFEKIELHARDTAIPFYEKLEYETVGEPFFEVGIKHLKMCKHL